MSGFCALTDFTVCLHSQIKRAVSRSRHVHHEKFGIHRFARQKNLRRALRDRFLHGKPRLFERKRHRFRDQSVFDCEYDSFHSVWTLLLQTAFLNKLYVRRQVGRSTRSGTYRQVFRVFSFFFVRLCRKSKSSRPCDCSLPLLSTDIPFPFFRATALLLLAPRCRRPFCPESPAPFHAHEPQVRCANANTSCPTYWKCVS